ncbi:MAG: NlpC/P60 family protein [Sphingobacteriia bacterium]
MRLNSYIIIVCLLVFTASCHSVKKTTTTKKKSTQKREFINGIEVTLGSTTKTKHNTNSDPSGNNKKESDAYTSKSEKEKAHYLQLKYAVILDVPTNKLKNIDLLELIDKWWGTKYCIGGNTQKCIDCSGFTQILEREIFYTTLPRTSQEQYKESRRVELEDLREGDLVFFGSGRSISHVGVYLQNNKFVHASTSQGVTITDLNDKYWKPKFVGGGRLRLF